MWVYPYHLSLCPTHSRVCELLHHVNGFSTWPDWPQKEILTCQSQSRHSLVFWLLQPLRHSPECLAARLQLRPRLGVAQQVRECSLRATQDALGEDCLWNAVAFQLGADPLGQLLRVYLLDVVWKRQWCCSWSDAHLSSFAAIVIAIGFIIIRLLLFGEK